MDNRCDPNDPYVPGSKSNAGEEDISTITNKNVDNILNERAAFTEFVECNVHTDCEDIP